jgi:hypothetical protein
LWTSGRLDGERVLGRVLKPSPQKLSEGQYCFLGLFTLVGATERKEKGAL